MLIPKLLWPLLVYEICSTIVEAIEAKINKFTRRWLGVPPGVTDVAMYCRKAKLRLPLKSILEEYKCGKARLLSMLEDSEDKFVKTVQPTIKAGRKWKVVEAVDEAKECLKIKTVIGQTQTDRKGLGSSTAKWWSKAEGKEKRDMVINEIRLNEDSKRFRKQSSNLNRNNGAIGIMPSINPSHGATSDQLSYQISERSPALKRKSGTMGKETGPLVRYAKAGRPQSRS